ncbi:type II toxin-antitoxin system RelE/ParE family toxin [Cryomorphaceae bacterium]|nr:type II toxin-antitoxin system RelE/ParE family toxin [Cryomorphaceae bacterium]
MGHYQISQKALLDLEEIVNFTLKQWSQKQSKRYYDGLIKTIESISLNPRIGKPYPGPIKGIRLISYERHLIYYRVSTLDKTILVVRILHQRMRPL